MPDVPPRGNLESFAAEHVTVAEPGTDTGVHVTKVARMLREAGVVEAIDRDILKTRIHRRRDVTASVAFEGWPGSL
jgi:hypothetical protein